MIDITTVVLMEDELEKNGTLHENWDYVVGYKGLGFHKLGAIFSSPANQDYGILGSVLGSSAHRKPVWRRGSERFRVWGLGA